MGATVIGLPAAIPLEGAAILTGGIAGGVIAQSLVSGPTRKWVDANLKEEDQKVETGKPTFERTKNYGLQGTNFSLPQTEQAAILADMGTRIARKVDVDIWEGDGATGNFNGLIPALLLDADVIDVATPIAITSSNVEAELGKFIDAIPDEVIGSAGLVMGVSTNVIRAIKRAYGTQARANGTFLKPSEFDFEGYTLTEIKGLNANTMVAYDKSQVFFVNFSLHFSQSIQTEIKCFNVALFKCSICSKCIY